jgi:ferrous iron transport protein A
MSTVVSRRTGFLKWLWQMRVTRSAATHHGFVEGAIEGRPSELKPIRLGTPSHIREIPLSALPKGDCGHITRLEGSVQGRLRLLEMGLTPGTHVQVLRLAAFGGPLDVEVRGYQLSLRREEAAQVWLVIEVDEPVGESS